MYTSYLLVILLSLTYSRIVYTSYLLVAEQDSDLLPISNTTITIPIAEQQLLCYRYSDSSITNRYEVYTSCSAICIVIVVLLIGTRVH